jgi:photosystem II stability/assembly factor-like uncharacterized protein
MAMAAPVPARAQAPPPAGHGGAPGGPAGPASPASTVDTIGTDDPIDPIGPDDPIKDDPIGRREWFGKWFGRVTAEHLDWATEVGLKEIERWGHLIPGTAAYRKPQLSPSGGIPPNVWRNIGPWEGSSVQNSWRDPNIVDAGRPTTIVPHPTNPGVLYAGFAGGGLWRCRNAYLAGDDWVWEPLTDGLPGGGNQSVGAAALAPDDPDTVYVSLGDMMSGSAPQGTAFGRGFYISKDGGQTWEKGATPGKCTRTKTVMALPNGRVLVAGNFGLFGSSDGGKTFARNQSGPLQDGTGESYPGALYPPNEYASTWDIVKLGDGSLVLSYQFMDGGGSYDGDTFYGYGSYGGGGVAYSTDNGATWRKSLLPARTGGTNVNGYGRISICASGNTMYGLFQDGSVPDSRYFPHQLIKSADGGRTWALISPVGLYSYSTSDGRQAGYNQMIAVDPDDPNTVFVGTNLTLYRSTDGGQTFLQFSSWLSRQYQYVHADMHVGVWTPPGHPSKALYLATDGGISIVRSPNIGTIPSGSSGAVVSSDPTVIDHRRNKGLSTHLVYNIGSTNAALPATGGIQPPKERIAAGMQDLGTLVRRNVERNLYDYTGSGGDGFGTLIHPYNGNLMLASIYYTSIRRSTNGGSSWQDASNGLSGSGPFYTRLYLGMADPTGNSVYTFDDTVPYRSGNFAANWTAMATTAASGWPSGAPAIRNINVSPLKQGLVGALFDLGYSPGKYGTVAISQDNGATWKTKSAVFPGNGGQLSCMAFDTADEDTMYAASVCPATWGRAGNYMGDTWNHIWKSLDGGDTWAPIDGSAANPNGFPFGTMVYVVKVDPVDNRVVYAGTEHGLYRTTNQGGAWERYGTGLPMVAVYDIYIAPDSSFMRVGTHGRGIWEMDGAEPVSIAIAGHPGGLFTGGSAKFSASVTGLSDASVAWTASAGSIDQQGSFVAPDASQTVTITAASVQAPSVKGTAMVKVSAADFDGNAKTDPQLLGLAKAFGSAARPNLDKYDFDDSGRVGDGDLDVLFAGMGW